MGGYVVMENLGGCFRPVAIATNRSEAYDWLFEQPPRRRMYLWVESTNPEHDNPRLKLHQALLAARRLMVELIFWVVGLTLIGLFWYGITRD